VLGPPGLPAEITQRVGDQVQHWLARKDIADRLVTMGADVAPAGAAELDRYMREHLQVWRRKVRDAGITPE